MINLLPKPIRANVSDTKFVINSNTTISTDVAFIKAVDFMQERLSASLGKTLAVVEVDGDISFIKDNGIASEGYIIDSRSGKMTITVSTFAGAIYAVQTLRILYRMDEVVGKDLVYSSLYIEDAPRYGWRALMLDVSRHYMEIDEIKRLLRLMSLHKLNVLHWHLTDDQGWRAEIKKYPLLTEIGSHRKDSQINGWRRTDMEGKPHSGHYTQEQMKDIVKYAEELAIMIVPEIDMPAHFAAAMAGYNWLACREIPCEVFHFCSGKVPESQGITDWNRAACAGKESTYQFVFDVIDELSEIFPSPYFHIGGDEAPKSEWKKCDKCQATMKANNLANEEELQAHFNNRIHEYIKTKNKKLIGWNEVLKGGNLDPNIVVQYWTPQRDMRVEKFVKAGGKVILSKHQAFYFDMCYGQYPLKNTYKFNPSKIGIPASLEGNIMGVEGAMWTEFIADRKKIDVNLFPRMEALAEVGWSQDCHKDFDDFLVRLGSFKCVLKALDVWYAEDEVSMPKGFLKRKRDTLTWYNSDQHMDVKYNEEFKKADNHGKFMAKQ